MNAHICHIGVVDHAGRSHYVALKAGVNVITGKSSTGKSALIEIFDYCFGAEEFTVPVGVITTHASYYFITIQIEQGYLTLVRTEKLKKQGLLIQSSDLKSIDPAEFNKATFADASAFTNLRDYKKKLGRIMGLVITDVDEDLKDRQMRANNAKKSTPSVRSLTSFMLQHQNLIANKHALFYRFDEKEKRDQLIDQFMIFLGHVDGEYYQLMQDLNAKRHKLDALTRFSLPQAEQQRLNARQAVQFELDKYSAASGQDLGIDLWESNPGKAIEDALSTNIQLDPLSPEHVVIRNKLEEERSMLIAERREIQQRLSLISATEGKIQDYKRKAQEVPTPSEGRDGLSYCFFCKNTHAILGEHANKLGNAIEWLNNELGRLRTLPTSLAEDRHVSSRLLQDNAETLHSIDVRIHALDLQVEDFKNKRSHLEIAISAKLAVIAALRILNDNPVAKIELEMARLKKEIEALLTEIKQRYDLVDHHAKVEKRLKDLMKLIGGGFEFEASYRPINLRFSTKSFELWHVGKEDEKVFLRSMGSGANWLSCHLTLFLALNRYFCELGNQCVIPPILFLDQPSQVYFPTILDTDAEFSAKKIGEREGSTRKRAVDDDVKAVTNLFSRFVEFCSETKKATGIEPQIIVTDHADNLTLDGDIKFHDLVRAKWRGPNDGLIQVTI